LPDIDLDVESARRLEVYDRIFERFGRERVAVTGMPETYRARQSLRHTGLALGIAPQAVDRIAKAFPHLRARDIPDALVELPELRQLASEAKRFGPLWELAAWLDALPHGYAMHPCGMILSDASLLDRLPVQPTPDGSYPMVQADKDDVEDLGLLKLDVLGVRMKSAMAHAVAEIRRTTGRQLDLDSPAHVDLADPTPPTSSAAATCWAASRSSRPASRTSSPACSPATCRTSSPTSRSSARARSPAACPPGSSPPGTAPNCPATRTPTSSRSSTTRTASSSGTSRSSPSSPNYQAEPCASPTQKPWPKAA